MYLCCAITNQGVRPNNEDALLIHKTIVTEGVTETRLQSPFIAAVADGVSGEHSGEVASFTCLDMLRSVNFSSRTDMDAELNNIHQTLAQIGAQDDETVNMQTTLCAVGIDENEMIHTINVGDSRLYRYRSGTLIQLSRDQSLVQMLYEEGSITKAEKETSCEENIMVLPALFNSRRKSTNQILVFSSSALKGSSKDQILGFIVKIEAIATFFFSPPDK